MTTLTADQISDMKLMTDIYLASINEDLENAEMDGETLMKVVSSTCQLTMLNAMEITRLNEEIKRLNEMLVNPK
jgi:peptidoglycan hydrolase CwlO-like protein|tara:strand:- start:275 stop:496 length:222 start_codon:yes stop_codon:yes gene_type:complete